jgi:hypothetical protein
MAHIFWSNQLSLSIRYGESKAKTWVGGLKDIDRH